jgi:hypothetical protein
VPGRVQGDDRDTGRPRQPLELVTEPPRRELEIPCQPALANMIAGRPLLLAKQAQALVGLYSVKHVLLVSLWSRATSNPKPERWSSFNPYLTPQDYRRFRESLRPPPGTKVWIGRVVDSDSARERDVLAVMPELNDSDTQHRDKHLLPKGRVARSSGSGTSSSSARSSPDRQFEPSVPARGSSDGP